MKLRKLKTNTPGTLYLHSMPGRYEALDEFIAQAERLDIQQLVCLNSAKEIRQKSPDYARTCENGTFPIQRTVFPITDFGTPADKSAYYQLVNDSVEKLKKGENILVHCAGGVGRTGMFAGTVLMTLKLPLTLLEKSGSYPEEDEQMQIIEHYQ